MRPPWPEGFLTIGFQQEDNAGAILAEVPFTNLAGQVKVEHSARLVSQQGLDLVFGGARQDAVHDQYQPWGDRLRGGSLPGGSGGWALWPGMAQAAEAGQQKDCGLFHP